MTDEKPYPGAEIFFSHPNQAKCKLPSAIPSFTPNYFPQVGMLALFWGAYDGRFNRLLAALIDANKDDSEPMWRGLDYKRRRKLCRKNIAIYFRNRPAMKDYLLKTLDLSAEIHNKRNAILHGKIVARLTAMPDATVKCELITESRINGRDVSMRFMPDDIETLACDILHLMGRIALTGATAVPGVSLSDTGALAELLSRIPIETILPK